MGIDEKIDKAIDGIRESRIACLDAIHTLSDIKMGMLSGHQKIADEAYQRGYQHAKNECEDCPKNVDLDAIRKEAYEKGLSDSKKQDTKDFADMYDSGYSEGLKDAWDAAKKIIGDDIPPDDLVKMFGSDPYSLVGKIFDTYSASEAIEKIRKYEHGKSKVRIGDEVETLSGKAVVYNVSDEYAEALRKMRENE